MAAVPVMLATSTAVQPEAGVFSTLVRSCVAAVWGQAGYGLESARGCQEGCSAGS